MARTVSEETKKKISNKLKGRKYSKETIERMRLGHTGLKHTPEHIANFIKSTTGMKKKFKEGYVVWNKGIKGEEYIKHYKNGHPLKNIPLKEEHIKKLRLAHLGKKRFPHTKETKVKMSKAREFIIIPKEDTSIEIKVQEFLKDLNIEYFTHQYIKDIEHSYHCDILIPSKNLVIECDGDYWHKYPTGKDIDHVRTKELIEKGFKVLRLWEHEINDLDLKKFKDLIYGI